MRDQTCTYCGKTGHRAHRCPTRQHAMPWTGLDLFVATVLVALIAAVSCA
jgi:Zinc knuckle